MAKQALSTFSVASLKQCQFCLEVSIKSARGFCLSVFAEGSGELRVKPCRGATPIRCSVPIRLRYLGARAAKARRRGASSRFSRLSYKRPARAAKLFASDGTRDLRRVQRSQHQFGLVDITRGYAYTHCVQFYESDQYQRFFPALFEPVSGGSNTTGAFVHSV